VGPLAVIEDEADIGEGVIVGPGCVVQRAASIGAGSRLVSRVSLYPGVRIGRRCILHAGAVVGADGFGFAPDAGTWVKVPQVGGVKIGDDVEIGANTTIDRGAIDDTVLEHGVKLDNQIQVGHNVTIGAHTAIAGCVGISGSTTIGRRCMIGGGVGIAGHLTIADDVVVTGVSLVSASIKHAGSYSSGMPAVETPKWRRMVALLRRWTQRSDDERAWEDGYRSDSCGNCRIGIPSDGRSSSRMRGRRTGSRAQNVTFNEPFFTGHFPHRPVMPGVMIIEALAQAAGILAFKTAKVTPDNDTRFYSWPSTMRASASPRAGRSARTQGDIAAGLQGDLEVSRPGRGGRGRSGVGGNHGGSRDQGPKTPGAGRRGDAG